jgi:hypothetical protein
MHQSQCTGFFIASWVALLGAVGCGSDDSDSKGAPSGGAGSAASGGTTGGSGAKGGASGTGGSTSGGSSDSGGESGIGGTMSSGGTTSSGGSGGTTSSGGSGGTTSSGGSAGTAGAGATGTQPLGAICANDTNCSQSAGSAVCCESSCTLEDQCPSSALFLPCEATADCAMYGGGKLCCEAQTSEGAMRFCTKRSACSGEILP